MCLAAVLAERGLTVTGVDLDQTKVDALNGGECPLYEPRLASMLEKNRQRTHGVQDIVKAVVESQITFAVVPTPSDRTMGFSLKYVIPVMKEIGKGLAEKKEHHLVVLTSTVMPGSTAGTVLPTLEAASDKKCPADFGLCYNPEFIALGDAINGMLNPDMVLIGESDKDSGDRLEDLQRSVCMNSPAFVRMNFVNAELAKISVNSYVTMKMSFANTLAELCENLPGGDVDRVTEAIGNDRRVGGLYLKGAAGYSGPCFPRDNLAFASLAKRVGAQAELAEATHRVNIRQARRILTLARRAGLEKGMKVSVLGLSYKPNTNVIDESHGIKVCQGLARRGFEVHVHDPAASENARAVLKNSAKFHSSAARAVRASDICLIMTPWEEYKTLDPSVFKGKLLVDCWRILPGAKEISKRYVRVGVQSGAIAKPRRPE